MSVTRVEYVFRPIERWPRDLTPASKRRRSPFKAGWQDTMNKLDRELSHIHAKRVVIQMALQEDDLRLDGRPRAGATPTHPGVVIAFEGKTGPLLMPCDEFTDWHANVRAIAMTLERLRFVDMYGVTKHGEQYTGWKKLPPEAASGMDLHAAAALIAAASGFLVDRIAADADYFAAALRGARIRLHPDKGGSHDSFVRCEQAGRVLQKYFEGRSK